MIFQGLFKVYHIRRHRCLGTYEAKNDVTDEGLSHILETQFLSGTQEPFWYIGLIDSVSFSQLANNDTMASHGGWQEFINYTSTRKAWDATAAGVGIITDLFNQEFTITVLGGDIRGLFLTTENIVGGTIGTLWSTALFTQGSQNVQDGDIFKVQYTVRAQR